MVNTRILKHMCERFSFFPSMNVCLFCIFFDVQQIVFDEQKFKLADTDQDGKLTLSEYAALSYPYHFDHMNALDIERLKKQYDLDNNGYISKFEYLSYGIEERQELDAQDLKDAQDALLEEFESADTDNNGVLDAKEVKEWIAPGTFPQSRTRFCSFLLPVNHVATFSTLLHVRLMHVLHVSLLDELT